MIVSKLPPDRWCHRRQIFLVTTMKMSVLVMVAYSMLLGTLQITMQL